MNRRPTLLVGMMWFARVILALGFLPVMLAWVVLIRLRPRRTPPRLFWGPVPIISVKYWSRALRPDFDSDTFVWDYYSQINRREDFDHYPGDLFGKWTKPLWPQLGFLWALGKYDIFHVPCSGGLLGVTPFWRLEAPLLRMAGRKVVVLPYGADAYCYSRIRSLSWQHGLLVNYPENARIEPQIERRIRYWEKWADALIPTLMGPDGFARWDVLTPSYVSIDLEEWKHKTSDNGHDGVKGLVKICHTPNHRGIKGTEFLVSAVKRLKERGLQVELVLLENVQNQEVRRFLHEEADILAEQFLSQGYALSAIEGMATGLPVLGSLGSRNVTAHFRRFSFLDECPVISSSPEDLESDLEILVTHPELRHKLGQAGRLYVEKYHSPEAARHMFGSVYERIWDGKLVDLINLFHPLKSNYRKSQPVVEHPLVNNRIED